MLPPLFLLILGVCLVNFFYASYARVEESFGQDDYAYTAHEANMHDTTMLQQKKSVTRVDLDAQNNEGQTPLHYTVIYHSADNECYKAAVLLLESGANVNMQDIWGKTPLHYAALRVNSDFMRLFLLYGANYTLPDNDGYTAFDYFEQRGGSSRALLFGEVQYNETRADA